LSTAGVAGNAVLNSFSLFGLVMVLLFIY